MSALTQLERKGIFRLTRGLTLGIVFLLFIGIVVVAVMAGKIAAVKYNSKVTIQQIKEVITPAQSGDSSATTNAVGPVLDGIKLPPRLQSLVNSNENKALFARLLGQIDKQDRQDYVDNFELMLKEGNQLNIANTDVANAYHELKTSAINAKKTSGEIRNATLKVYATVAFSGLALIALFSLVLVLLAIERNTRQATSQE